MAVTPSSARTCMIIRAPDIVWPASGCPKGRGWMTVSLMGARSFAGGGGGTYETSSLRTRRKTCEQKVRGLVQYVLTGHGILYSGLRSTAVFNSHASHHRHTP